MRIHMPDSREQLLSSSTNITSDVATYWSAIGPAFWATDVAAHQPHGATDGTAYSATIGPAVRPADNTTDNAA